MDAAPVPSPARSNGLSKGLLALVVILLAAAVIAAYFLFPQVFHKKSIALAVPQNARVELMSAAGADWYGVMSNRTLSLVPGPAGFSNPSLVVLAAASSSVSSDTVVIGHVPKTPGDVLARLHAGGSYTPLVVDGELKQGLAARPDGFIAFSEVGTTSAAAPALKLLAPAATSSKSLGAGRPLAALGSGAFLVATPSGIEALDPVTRATTSVVANGSLVSAVSGSSNRLATVNPQGFIDLYAIASSTGRLSYQYSIFDATTTTAVGFIGSDYLLAQTSPDATTLYYLLATQPIRLWSMPLPPPPSSP